MLPSFLGKRMRRTSGSNSFVRAIDGFVLPMCLVGIAVFVFLTLLLLPEQANLYLEILKGLGIFAAGTAGGYGLKAYQDSRRAS